MKKIMMVTMLLFAVITGAFAQKQAQIAFDKTTWNFGTFAESQIQTCTFTFKNTGDADALCRRTPRNLSHQARAAH